MKAFDTDILTEILAGNPAYAERIAKVPLGEQAAPIVAVEEIIRGRLNAIRQAEAAKARITIEQAYLLFEQTLDDIRVGEKLVLQLFDDDITIERGLARPTPPGTKEQHK